MIETVPELINLERIQAAQDRIKGSAMRTPLVPLNVAGYRDSVFLKLENLQPIGSFKIRGAANALALADPEQLKRGISTASAGNMAQGVAFEAKRRGVSCTVYVPESAPKTKCAAAQDLGATIIRIPFEDWWDMVQNGPGAEHAYFFVHPVADPAVIAGNAVIALEILEDLPEVETVLIPFGGGGLSGGIGSAFNQIKSTVQCYGVEVETAAPLDASWKSGSPQNIDRIPTFVDGIGGAGILPPMWPLLKNVLSGAKVTTIQEIANTVKLLIEKNRILAEGAGAASVACALKEKEALGKTVCVISGGNIDLDKVEHILRDEVPQ